MEKKYKLKWKNIFLIFLFIVLIVIALISLSNIIKWKKENDSTEDIVNKIEEKVTINEVTDNDNVEIIEVEEEKSNPYWDYIKMNLIDVDFNELKEINKNTVGWIQVNGTNINYPFVQVDNNKYYLTHSFDNSYNSAGWVFLDYRNSLENMNKNTIIYAHGRLDNSMFGSLRNILKSNWLKNKNNFVIKLSTEYQNTLWQVFSVYKIPTTNDYIKVEFSNDKNYLEFLNMLKERSAHDFNTSITEKDNILTLSTCYDDDNKVVLHAKLIKKEVKTN